jgi:hypothetical protein
MSTYRWFELIIRIISLCISLHFTIEYLYTSCIDQTKGIMLLIFGIIGVILFFKLYTSKHIIRCDSCGNTFLNKKSL